MTTFTGGRLEKDRLVLLGYLAFNGNEAAAEDDDALRFVFDTGFDGYIVISAVAAARLGVTTEFSPNSTVRTVNTQIQGVRLFQTDYLIITGLTKSSDEPARSGSPGDSGSDREDDQCELSISVDRGMPSIVMGDLWDGEVDGVLGMKVVQLFDEVAIVRGRAIRFTGDFAESD